MPTPADLLNNAYSALRAAGTVELPPAHVVLTPYAPHALSSHLHLPTIPGPSTLDDFTPAEAEIPFPVSCLYSREHAAATLLHAAAHLCLSPPRYGTDVNGRHNQTFRDAAQRIGLLVASPPPPTPGTPNPDYWRGYSRTFLPPPASQSQYVAVVLSALADLANATTASVGVAITYSNNATTEPDPPHPTRNKNNPAATCGCQPPNVIRASRRVLEKARPYCFVCGEVFSHQANGPIGD